MEIDALLHRVFIILLGCIQLGYSGDASEWRSGPPDGLPKMTSFDVECGKEDMTVHLEFNLPYDGSVYSKGDGSHGKCVHVSPRSHVTDATFTIGYDSCGTRSDSQGKFYENTIILQYDDDVIEAWDEAKKIRCEWHDGYEKSAYKTPITISDLDVVEMNFQGDDIDCWLEIQDGKGPYSSKVSGLVPLGSPLTLVVAIQDEEGHFDMRVKECKAHDGNRNPVYLTDEEGCVLRPKMMSPFRKTKDPKDSATVIAYSHFYAFKFPDTVDVHVQCTVEICRHGCSQECTQSRDASPQASIKPPIIVTREGEDPGDIPTYRDSYPHSTFIANEPDKNTSESDLHLTRHGADVNDTKNSAENVLNKVITKPEEENIATEETSYIFPDFMRHPKPEDLLDVFRDRHDVSSPDYVPFADKQLDYPSATREPDYYEDIDLFKEVFGDGKGFHIVHASDKLNDNAENTTHRGDTSEKGTLPHDELPPAVSSVTYEHTNQDDHFEKRVSAYLEQNDTKISNQEDAVNSHNLSDQTGEEEYVAAAVTSLSEDEGKHKEPNTKMSGNDKYDEHSSQNDDQTDIRTDINPNASEREHVDVQPEYEPHKLLDTSDTHDSSKGNPEISDYYENVPDYDDDLREKDNQQVVEKHLQNTEYDYYGGKYPSQARKHTKLNPRNRNVIDHSTMSKSYRPPVPVAPLTLYNGQPLHHYGQKANFLNSDKYRYIMHAPMLHQRYSHDGRVSYRMGKRRKRREIGDREQLGLQQTFQVIAPIDLAFATKDDDTSLYIGRQHEYGVCIAPTSFAAGLGLMILANVCVLCVVVFFGHHYYVNHRGKSNVSARPLLLALRNLLLSK